MISTNLIRIMFIVSETRSIYHVVRVPLIEGTGSSYIPSLSHGFKKQRTTYRVPVPRPQRSGNMAAMVLWPPGELGDQGVQHFTPTPHHHWPLGPPSFG